MPANDKKLLRVGELATAVGKSVRAIHLYEELGLVTPVERSAGGFRMFDPESIARIQWIGKLQVIGFSLAEIQQFVASFEHAQNGRSGAEQVREIFEAKLAETRATLAQLQIIETDLVDAIGYLESCQSCAPIYLVTECAACTHAGHEGDPPELFAGLSRKALDDAAGSDLVHLTINKDHRNN